MDVDMSLEQIIKKNKMRGGKPIRGKRGEGKGNGAPPTTITITNNKPQPKRSSLPIKRRRPSSIKSTTITTSTSNANNTASPPIPALKITIQNTPSSSSSSSLSTSGIKKTITGGKPGKLGGGSIGGSPSLKPKIRKSLSSDSPLKKRLDTRNNNIVVRSKNTPTRGGGSHSGGHIHNNNNHHHHHNQPQQSQYEDNEDFGSGSSLFERRSGYSPSSPSNSSYSPSTSRKPIQLYTGSRLNISNLHYGITESDLSVLFKKFGDVKNIRINYDSAGRSNGTGYCIFSRHADALQAMEMYNKIALDGKLLHITLGSSFQEDVRNL